MRNVKLIAFAISAFIARAAGTLYGYNFGSVSADRFTVLAALEPDRVRLRRRHHDGVRRRVRGLIAAQGVPYALDKWFGLSGNWSLLFGGVLLSSR